MRNNRYLILIIIIYACSMNGEKAKQQKLIKSLEYQLDTTKIIKKVYLIDSLLSLDSNNITGLKYKGTFELNHRNTKGSIKYFSKYLNFKPNSPLANLYLGISFEHEGYLDSALFYYQKAYDVGGSDILYYKKPHLITVLSGKKEALNWLSKTDSIDKNTFRYLRLINDIKNYQQTGLNEFFPIFFDDDYAADYYIKIPDSIYDNGIINSMHKVELFFAKNGINVDVEGTDTKNNGYYLSTTDKFEDQLDVMDTFSVTKLQLGDRYERPFD